MLTLFSRATIHRLTIWSWLQQPLPTPRQQIPPDSNYFSNTLSNSYVETPKVIVTAGHISLWCSPHSVDGTGAIIPDDEHLITVRGSVEVSHDHKNKNDATTYTVTSLHYQWSSNSSYEHEADGKPLRPSESETTSSQDKAAWRLITTTSNVKTE